MKVRRFRRSQADFERAGMSLRDDIWPTDDGWRGRTMDQCMSPVIGSDGCVARRCVPQCNIRVCGRTPILQDETGPWRKPRSTNKTGSREREKAPQKTTSGTKIKQTKRKTCAAAELVYSESNHLRGARSTALAKLWGDGPAPPAFDKEEKALQVRPVLTSVRSTNRPMRSTQPLR